MKDLFTFLIAFSFPPILYPIAPPNQMTDKAGTEQSEINETNNKTKKTPSTSSKWQEVETTRVSLKSVPREGYGRNSQMAGRVLDKKTKEPITGARVRLFRPDGTTTKMGAIADLKGNFLILNVPAGTYQIEIRYGVYWSRQIIKDAKIEPNHILNIGTVFLREKPFEGDTTLFRHVIPDLPKR